MWKKTRNFRKLYEENSEEHRSEYETSWKMQEYDSEFKEGIDSYHDYFIELKYIMISSISG